MLAYRHAFHAGNHADVLKHVVLTAVLRYLTAKDGRLTYIDTHAGAGGYALGGHYAKQSQEAAGGIEALRRMGSDDPLLMDYMDLVHSFAGLDLDQAAPGASFEPLPLPQYPGSPAIAAQLLRADDRMRLFERHPTDERILRSFLKERAHTDIVLGDGFAGLAKALPPTPRRGLVLIDPSYEVKTDYTATLHALRDALQRFAQGTYLVWYPLLRTIEATQLPKRLLTVARQSAPKGVLNATLRLAPSDARGFGLTGSGMLVVNPPFTLAEQLRATLPRLVQALGVSPDAGFAVQSH